MTREGKKMKVYRFTLVFSEAVLKINLQRDSERTGEIC